MRRLLVGVSALLMLNVGAAAAQDGWPFTEFKSERPRTAQRSKITARTTDAAPRPTRTPVPRRVASLQEKGTAPAAAGQGAPGASQWRVLRPAWTERDEKGFEEFVSRIGESRCRTMHDCLTGADSNPLYRASNPPGMVFYADCADLPYMLRAYYAWKNGLPFSYSTAVAPLGQSLDIRYTARGNKIVARRDIAGGVTDARRVIPEMMGAISSAHYRYPPNLTGGLPPDHYPVKVSRESIKPGTIIYDPNGHVAVVYRVTPEGRVHYIDTHPDNTLTRGVYGKAFSRASPAMGAGFKRWRPVRLEGAVQNDDGSLSGGRILLASDAELADWSDEQFFGTASMHPKTWSAGRFVHNGETLDYYDFVRKRLAKDGFKYDPLDETRAMVRALCEDIKYRVEAVDVAIKAGMHRRPQPDRLPMNIYGSEGDWETYSTPSRDARLKTAFKELRDEIDRFLSLARFGTGALAYAGSDLRRDLREVYASEAAACSIAYVRSNGSEQRLSFADVEQRLFRMSFDPYHCVELRWGALGADELATCPDESVKRAWYEAEQRLRNQADRTYDTRMGFGLAELRKAVKGSGVDEPPNVTLRKLLEDAPQPPSSGE